MTKFQKKCTKFFLKYDKISKKLFDEILTNSWRHFGRNIAKLEKLKEKKFDEIKKKLTKFKKKISQNFYKNNLKKFF